MVEDELEFTEEDMFSQFDRDLSDKEAGKENIPTNESFTPDKPKLDKLKRQRSAIPENHEVLLPSSPEEDDYSRKELADHPISSHFKDSGIASQSMTINRGKEMALRHNGSSDLEDTERRVSRLGTSMPITIPGMEKASNKAAVERMEANQTSNFVPPHLMSQDNDPRAASVNSGSISSGSMAKRDKLLQRNKILRRTGFLEGANVEQGKAGSGALAELMDPLNRRLMPITESLEKPSALSAALGTPGKDFLGPK